MTPRGFSLARELESGQHDPNRQLLFEVYSGHGSAEPYRDWPGAFSTGEDALVCPEPTSDYLPCCWQAGGGVNEAVSDGVGISFLAEVTEQHEAG